MGRLLFLTKPMGVSIVRLAYLTGLVVLFYCVGADIYRLLSLPAGFPLMAIIEDLAILVAGIVALRLIAEFLVVQFDIRDKLGALERNTHR